MYDFMNENMVGIKYWDNIWNLRLSQGNWNNLYFYYFLYCETFFTLNINSLPTNRRLLCGNRFFAGGDEEFDSVEEHVDDVTFISDKSKFSGNWTNLYTNFCPLTFFIIFLKFLLKCGDRFCLIVMAHNLWGFKKEWIEIFD